MGYYTRYNFVVMDYGKNGPSDYDIVEKILRINATNKGDEFAYPLVRQINSLGGLFNWDRDIPTQSGLDEISPDEEVTWYDAEDDIKKLSKEFPNVIFCLSGTGEEGGDEWESYFKNGKCHTYKPTMPKFNPLHLDINDEDSEAADLISNIVNLLNELKEKYPNAKLTVQSLDGVEKVSDLNISCDVSNPTEWGISVSKTAE